MAQHPFYGLFVDLLRDLFDEENQTLLFLPAAIQGASHQELKTALVEHMEETKNQLLRLKKIFKILNENPTGLICKPIQGLINQGEEAIKKNKSPAVKDAGLIIACQKIEHYEIAGYGSARAIARHLSDAGIDDRIDFDGIADLLQQSLDEESAADEYLTDIAEGGFFNQGINEEAEREKTKPIS